MTKCDCLPCTELASLKLDNHSDTPPPFSHSQKKHSPQQDPPVVPPPSLYSNATQPKLSSALSRPLCADTIATCSSPSSSSHSKSASATPLKINSFTSPSRSSSYPSYSISDFRILSSKPLTSDSFAEMYEVSSDVPEFKNLPLVLKCIRRDDLKNQACRQTIKTEIQLHWQLRRHPSILNFYTFFESQKGIYLVLEHCPYGDLASFLCLHGPLMEAHVRYILHTLISTLHFLHQHQVYFHNLHLSDVLLTEKYQLKLKNAWVKAIPHGTQAILKKSFNGKSSGEFQNDLQSPESEVWALGCLTFTLLTGEPAMDQSSMFLKFDTLLNSIKESQTVHLPTSLSQCACSFLREISQVNSPLHFNLNHVSSHPFLDSHLPSYPLIPTTPLSFVRIPRGKYPFSNQLLRVHSQGHLSQRVENQPDLIISEDGQVCQFNETTFEYPHFPPFCLARYLHVLQGVEQIRGRIPKLTLVLPHAEAVWMENNDFHMTFAPSSSPSCLSSSSMSTEWVYIVGHGVQVCERGVAKGPLFHLDGPTPSHVNAMMWKEFQMAFKVCDTIHSQHTTTLFPIVLKWTFSPEVDKELRSSISPTTSHSPSPSSSSSTSIPPTNNVTNPDATMIPPPPTMTVYLRGIGFCSRYTHFFRMYFEDGSLLDMPITASSHHPPSFKFAVPNSSGGLDWQTYLLSSSLKDEWKKKLKYLVQGVQLIKQIYAKSN